MSRALRVGVVVGSGRWVMAYVDPGGRSCAIQSAVCAELAVSRAWVSGGWDLRAVVMDWVICGSR
jgi:hypothetical protein